MESTYDCVCRLPVVLCVEIVHVAFLTLRFVAVFSTSSDNENENDDSISTSMTYSSLEKKTK